jgi:pyroglutamyl-peptidase
MGKYLVLLLLQLPLWGFAQTILLTGFKPFGGRSINTSYQLVQALQKKLIPSGAKITICELPVVYGQAFDVAKKCYENLDSSPDLVLSFGEGTSRVELDQASINFAGNYPDENSMAWGGKQILTDRPNQYRFSMSTEKLYCAIPARERDQVPVSPDPGNFLCNYVAYTMSNFFFGQDIPYAFIHVPALAEYQSAELDKMADYLSEMIFRQVEGPQNTGSALYQECLSDYQSKIVPR